MNVNRHRIKKDYFHGPPTIPWQGPSKRVRIRFKKAIRALLQSDFQNTLPCSGLGFLSILLKHIRIFLADFCPNWNPNWNTTDWADHTYYSSTEMIRFLFFIFVFFLKTMHVHFQLPCFKCKQRYKKIQCYNFLHTVIYMEDHSSALVSFGFCNWSYVFSLTF